MGVWLPLLLAGCLFLAFGVVAEGQGRADVLRARLRAAVGAWAATASELRAAEHDIGMHVAEVFELGDRLYDAQEAHRRVELRLEDEEQLHASTREVLLGIQAAPREGLMFEVQPVLWYRTAEPGLGPVRVTAFRDPARLRTEVEASADLALQLRFNLRPLHYRTQVDDMSMESVGPHTVGKHLTERFRVAFAEAFPGDFFATLEGGY